MSRNHHRHHSSDHNQNILLGVLAGTVVGALTAAAMCTTKGKAIRESLRDNLSDAYDYASEKYSDAADSISDTASDLSDRFLHRQKQSSDHTNLAIGAIAGGILGLSALMYLTSGSGKAKGFKERIAHSFENLSDKAHSYQDMAHSAVDSIGENVSPLLDKIDKLICAFTNPKSGSGKNKKNLSGNDTIDNILDWAVTAAQVYQSFKK